MTEKYRDSEEERKIKEKLLNLDRKVDSIVEQIGSIIDAINKLDADQNLEEEVQDAETAKSYQNLLKLVQFIKESDAKQDKDRKEDYKKLSRNTKKVAEELKELLGKYAKEMFSFQSMKNAIDNEQDLNAAKLKAEMAKEKATTHHQRVALESKIDVNKADMAKEKIVFKNTIHQESLNREEEDARIRNDIEKLDIRQSQSKAAMKMATKHMNDRAKELENRVSELEKIIAVLKEKN